MREFINLLGAAAVAWPIVARAQQPDRVRRIGVLMSITRDPDSPMGKAFKQALVELGWNEGRNIEFEYRWAGADVDQMRTFAKELAGLNPDVIVGTSTQVVLALLRETRAVPIVFRDVVDPVATGLVRNLSRPGGNITGFTNFEPSIMGKFVEFLKEIAPQTTCVAFLRNPPTGTPGPERFIQSSDAAAASLGLKVIRTSVHDTTELDAAVAALSQEPNCGVVVAPSSFFAVHQARVIDLMARHRCRQSTGFVVSPKREACSRTASICSK